MSCFHLDTDYLINYLDAPTRAESSHASKVVNRLLSKGRTVKTSLLTLGEAVKVCSEDPEKVDPERLTLRIKQGKITIYRPESADLQALANAIEVTRKEVWGVGAMDIVHLAHALTDQTAEGFLTFDYKIINNHGIARLRRSGIWRDGFVIGNDSGV